MNCYELLKPYVRWAAHDQVVDPFRYVLGFQLSYLQVEGTRATIDGKVDINDARFANDGERFALRLRGSGTFHSHPSQSSTNLDGSLDTNEPRNVIIQVDANQDRILVRIGDVKLREVTHSFTAECRENFFVGFADNKAYVMTLQKLERVDTGWRIVDETEVEQAMAAPTAPVSAKPIETVPDDLQRIEGIGAKSASVLNSMGVTTYAQLAAFEPEQLERQLTAAGLELIPGAAKWWPAQAALAATGHWNQLKAVQTELLKGGRYSVPDNLQKISGIGPAVSAQLDAMGITSFRQLAEANPEQLESDLKAAGVNIPLGTTVAWPDQAKLAAEQRWVELEKTQKELSQLQNDLQTTS